MMTGDDGGTAFGRVNFLSIQVEGVNDDYAFLVISQIDQLTIVSSVERLKTITYALV